MATIEDVKPGSRWLTETSRVVGQLTNPFARGRHIVIGHQGPGGWDYEYEGGGVVRQGRSAETILTFCTLVSAPPKCAASCSPAAPCVEAPTCPGKGPEYTGREGFSAWDREQVGLLTLYNDVVRPPGGTEPRNFWERIRFWSRDELRLWGVPRGPEPMRNGSGALACDWIQRRG